MLTLIAQWLVLPCNQQRYSMWATDWRTHLLALLYPLFDLGVISLLAAGLAWRHTSSALLPLGLLIWGCICLAIWWTRRMCMIATIRFYETDILSLSKFEERVKLGGYAETEGLFRIEGSRNVLIPLLPKKKANTLLGEIAANYAEYVTPTLPFLIKGSVEEDEPGLVCLVLKLPKQEYSFYEEIEQIATDMGRFRVVEAVKKVKGVAPLPPSHS